jgi:hypothetical protein
MKRYRVITGRWTPTDRGKSKNQKDFENKVESALNEGWETEGPAQVSWGGETRSNGAAIERQVTVCQTLVKR